jgi:hypothetical protein
MSHAEHQLCAARLAGKAFRDTVPLHARLRMRARLALVVGGPRLKTSAGGLETVRGQALPDRCARRADSRPAPPGSWSLTAVRVNLYCTVRHVT